MEDSLGLLIAVSALVVSKAKKNYRRALFTHLSNSIKTIRRCQYLKGFISMINALDPGTNVRSCVSNLPITTGITKNAFSFNLEHKVFLPSYLQHTSAYVGLKHRMPTRTMS